jgi:hypothetical protein
MSKKVKGKKRNGFVDSVKKKARFYIKVKYKDKNTAQKFYSLPYKHESQELRVMIKFYLETKGLWDYAFIFCNITDRELYCFHPNRGVRKLSREEFNSNLVVKVKGYLIPSYKARKRGKNTGDTKKVEKKEDLLPYLTDLVKEIWVYENEILTYKLIDNKFIAQ